MTNIKKCIIPAAGRGTRFLPASKAIAKEIFPVVDTPVIELLIQEAVSAGCEEIIIVTGKGKDEIIDHFDANRELEKSLEGNEKKKYLLDALKNTTHGAKIYSVRQPYPKGDGDAIMQARSFIWDEPFLVLFWDDLVFGEYSAAQQLSEAFSEKKAPVIATYKVSEQEVSHCGIIESSEDGKVFWVEKFLEKPQVQETTARAGVIGKYILTPQIFEYLEKSTPINSDGETRLADAFELMRKDTKIYWVDIQWERCDTGNKFGYLKANILYGLQHPETREELKKFLEKIC